MSGSIALHGGGEFQSGDEAFLAAWLATAPHPGDTPGRPLRVAVVPTAAARGRPDLVAAHGVAAIGRVAGRVGLAVEVSVVPVLDAAGAADTAMAASLATADAIHLPGGDPDLIPTVLGGTAAWAAIRTAVDGGATLAGASAGAMALAAWTWTPAGGQPGLGLLPGPALLVMPHADAGSWQSALRRFGRGLPSDIGVLGIGEHTGVFIDLYGDAPWRVAGEGEVRWVAPGGDLTRPTVHGPGDTFRPAGG